MKREFLDPKALLVNAVAQWLVARMRVTPGGARALDHLLVVVPTRQAGRRLRLALAARTGGCIPPQIRLPHSLIAPAREPPFPVATQTESTGLLAHLLTGLALADFPDLFPEAGRPGGQTFPWALNVSRQLHDLWRILGENALTMADVAARVGHLLGGDNLDSEIRRWRDLARLEAVFFSALERLRLTPAARAQQHAAHDPAVPEGIEEIVLPALADALPAFYTALKRLAHEIPVTVLLHADPSQDECFDVWGCPIPERWTGENAPHLPLADAHITLAANSLEQAQRAAERYAACVAHGAAPALAMADDALFSDLQSAFLARGLTLHNPAAYPVAVSPLGRLLRLLEQLAGGQTFTALSAFLREADVQRWAEHALRGGAPFNYAKALRELDDLQNEHLPQTLADVRRHCTGTRGFPNLSRLLKRLDALLAPPATDTYGGHLLATLKTLFAARTVQHGTPGDRELIAAASATCALIESFDSDALRTALSPAQTAQLFASRVTAATYQLEPDIPGTVLTEGWLELQWNADTALIITGFNEGAVPDAVAGHAFLPDRLRQGLGLASNDQRMARDTCLLHALLRARPAAAVHIFLERVSARNDVRKPSRLLFLCDDATLVARAQRLFAEAQAAPAGHPRTLPPAWRLDLPLPPPAPDALPVTAFKDYLACPFTYYLRHVLRMEAQDDRARELDAMAFGGLIHDALDAFAKSPDNDSADPDAIQAFLEGHVWETLRGRFGNRLTAVLHLQGAAACERLAFAAQEQARLAARGWRIQHAERTETLEGCGMTIRGRIDRIDRHEASGAWRVLDYKTWARLGDNNGLDRFSTRKRAKLDFAAVNGLPAFTLGEGARPRVWTDLQLPLYLLMAHAGGLVPSGAAVECGYFVLGETAADTRVAAWDFSGLLDTAEATARHVIRRVQAGIFWPPQDIAPDYLPLLLDPNTPGASLSPRWLDDQRERTVE